MDYIYIQAWGELTGSLQYYIDAQMARAQADNAPETAIFKGDDGAWHTFEDIKREDTKQAILDLVERRKDACNNDR